MSTFAVLQGCRVGCALSHAAPASDARRMFTCAPTSIATSALQPMTGRVSTEVPSYGWSGLEDRRVGDRGGGSSPVSLEILNRCSLVSELSADLIQPPGWGGKQLVRGTRRSADPRWPRCRDHRLRPGAGPRQPSGRVRRRLHRLARCGVEPGHAAERIESSEPPPTGRYRGRFPCNSSHPRERIARSGCDVDSPSRAPATSQARSGSNWSPPPTVWTLRWRGTGSASTGCRTCACCVFRAGEGGGRRRGRGRDAGPGAADVLDQPAVGDQRH